MISPNKVSTNSSNHYHSGADWQTEGREKRMKRQGGNTIIVHSPTHPLTHWWWISPLVLQHLLCPPPTLISLGQYELPDWANALHVILQGLPTVLRTKNKFLTMADKDLNIWSLPLPRTTQSHWSQLTAQLLHDPRPLSPLTMLFPLSITFFPVDTFINPIPP